MPARRDVPVATYVFAGWTVFVWIGRIRLGGSIWLAGPFVVLAVLAAWRKSWWLTVLAAFTVAVWAIRTPMILAHDHPADFKAVHVVLAVVSVALAVWAVTRARRSTPASRPRRPSVHA